MLGAAAVLTDGTVVAGGNDSFSQITGATAWTDIAEVAQGQYHIVGRKTDGTAVAAGRTNYGQTSVTAWTDLVKVAAQYSCTIGLKSDGTVVTCGQDTYGQTTDAALWSGIKDVACGGTHNLGLLDDGTVVHAGATSSGEDAVDGWTGIVQIAAGPGFSLGWKDDGTVVACGDDYYGEVTDPQSWYDAYTAPAGEETDAETVVIDMVPSVPISFSLSLTGDADSTTDITLPVKNFTARLRSGSDSYLSVTLPYTSEIVAAISARSNGDLYLYYTDATGTYEVVNVSLDSIQISKGTSSKSIVLTGYRQSTNDGTGSHEIVANATVAGDTSTITIPGYAPEILAGDSVSYDDLSITANLITLTAQASNFSVQTVYSEGS
jgi:alpha-tubulin suppressor-like RCC1 family protein